ncbi:MAG: tyrosine-type recombinase/integrase [Bacteroidaceae bacterium]|nr:tyrosine-type recombinase/integrase [Bacteroidaceae bacterium]
MLSSFDFRNYTLQDGYYVSTGERKKTGTKFTSILLPKAIEIVRKYGGRELPVMCNNDYNRDLKLLAAHAGIKKRIYSHLGRHTFATMALAHGVSVQNVSRMIGHSSLRQTLHYAKILEQSVISDVAAHLGDDSSK